MHHRWFAASFFVAFSDLALAQSPAILGKADTAFARALYDKGFPDLAEKVASLAEKSGSVRGAEQVALKSLLLDLRMEVAVRDADLVKRYEALKQVLADKEEFIKQYEGRKEAAETSNTLPDVYEKLGTTLTTLVQKEKDPALIAKFQDEGSKVYGAAEKTLKERLEPLRADHEDAAKEEQFQSLLFNLPRTQYFHSLLYGKEEFKRKALLEDAILGFQTFNLEFSGIALSYYAIIYEGLSNKELDRFDDAISCFDDVIKVRENYEVDKKGEFQFEPIVGDVISWAVLQKMMTLHQKKDFAGELAEAKKFIDTTPDWAETQKGLPVLVQRGEALKAQGDMAGFLDVAAKLVELDPRGPYGAIGRTMQSDSVGASAGSMDTEQVMKIAQTLIDKGDTDKGLRLLHVALGSLKADAKGDEMGAQIWLQIGQLFRERGLPLEAALAFDLGAEKHAAAKDAAELVYQAQSAYRLLNKNDKRKYYTSRIEERQKTLAGKYSTHPRAQRATLYEADALVDDGKFLEAAEQYTRVQPGSPVYSEALYKQGRSLASHIDALGKQGKEAEVKNFAEQAETLLKTAILKLDEQAPKTMDLAEKSSIMSNGLQARLTLAQLYLAKGVSKPAEAVKTLEGADERYKDNAAAIDAFWKIRLRAYKDMGKIDEAMALLDALALKNPESSAVATGAGLLAGELDQRAVDLRDTQKKPVEAAAMQKKAAQYYVMAGKALLRSPAPDIKRIMAIANRMYLIGLDQNEVPATQTTFVGYDKPIKEKLLWELSVDLFDAGLKLAPDREATVTVARIYGFLGRYEDAALKLAALFDQNPVLLPDGKIDRQLFVKNQVLLYAAFEYAVAEAMVGAKTGDVEHGRLANSIFTGLATGGMFTASGQNWWLLNYYQAKNNFDSGNYQQADIKLRDLERSTSGMGEQFGLKPLFEKLKSDLAEKLK